MTSTSWRVRPGKIVLKTRKGPFTDNRTKKAMAIVAELKAAVGRERGN